MKFALFQLLRYSHSSACTTPGIRYSRNEGTVRQNVVGFSSRVRQRGGGWFIYVFGEAPDLSILGIDSGSRLAYFRHSDIVITPLSMIQIARTRGLGLALAEI